MLCARRNLMAGGGVKPWANPYITDGLVMLVDLEGSGGEFIDLISGSAVGKSLNPYYSSERKAVVFPAGGRLEYPISNDLNAAFLSGNLTLELCCYIVPYTSTTYRILLSNDGSLSIYTPRSTGTQRYLYYNGYGRTNSVSNYLDEDGTAKGTVQVTYDWRNLTTRRFKTGVFTGSASIATLPSADITSFYSSLMGGAEFYSLRVYNRPLTDAELLANATVDKERFGLQ